MSFLIWGRTHEGLIIPVCFLTSSEASVFRGEISISQEDLGPLIETARCLQIKGGQFIKDGLSTVSPGLSMATPTPPLSSPKKRPHSVMGGEGYSSPPAALQRRRGGRQKLSPSTSSLSPEAGEHLQQQREEQERDQEMEVGRHCLPLCNVYVMFLF